MTYLCGMKNSLDFVTVRSFPLVCVVGEVTTFLPVDVGSGLTSLPVFMGGSATSLPVSVGG